MLPAADNIRAEEPHRGEGDVSLRHGSTLEQLLMDEQPDAVVPVWAKAVDMLLNTHLAEPDERVQKTQTEMAQVSGIKQPTVFNILNDR